MAKTACGGCSRPPRYAVVRSRCAAERRQHSPQAGRWGACGQAATVPSQSRPFSSQILSCCSRAQTSARSQSEKSSGLRYSSMRPEDSPSTSAAGRGRAHLREARAAHRRWRPRSLPGRRAVAFVEALEAGRNSECQEQADQGKDTAFDRQKSRHAAVVCSSAGSEDPAPVHSSRGSRGMKNTTVIPVKKG